MMSKKQNANYKNQKSLKTKKHYQPHKKIHIKIPKMKGYNFINNSNLTNNKL